MVKDIFEGGRKLLYSKQTSILSAAVIIMFMTAASRVLGLVKNRTLVHFFPPETLDTFYAAFQLPDTIFEILVLGTMSSAFIPVFTKYISQGKDANAWKVSSIFLNIMLLFFLIFSAVVFIFATPIYSIIAPRFTPEQIAETVFFTRMLLVAQVFFIASFHLTAVLESSQRFLTSAIAPLFYSAGIIISTVLFSSSLGLLAPVLGVVLGSALHFLVQLPVAVSLGYRLEFNLDFRDPGVRKIGKLAMPRIIELSFLQVKRFTDLFIALLAAGSVTYFKFGDSLAALPVGLFGLSIAKASLPMLSKLTAGKDLKEFKLTFSSSFKEILFLVFPISVMLAVLRIPIVRLAYGADQFDWQDTIQTGYVLSAFTVGAFAYSLSLLTSRAFYALQDTVTPVKVSIATILVNVGLGLILILGLKLPIWGLALSYSAAGIVQLILLLILLSKKIGGFGGFGIEKLVTKVFISGGTAGTVTFLLLKLLDRSAWDKKLSFLGKFGLALPTTFDKFVLDTRYTLNLLLVTILVAAIGGIIYLVVAHLLRVDELKVIFRVARRVSPFKLPFLAKNQSVETVAPIPNNTT